jgi:hypothetical protein
MRTKMITIMLVCSMGWISGCASSNASKPPTPFEQELILDKQIHSMSRNEVITAVRECESTGLRAVMMYGKRKVNGYSADIVIDVTCAPR